MVKNTYNSTEEMTDKSQELKGETKLKIYQSIGNCYDRMNKYFRFEEAPSAKNAQDIKFYHEVLLIMKFVQTKPQVKNMNNKYYDLFYTVIEKGDDKVIVNDKYNKNEKDYVFF